jgi:hypothetical protein
MLAGSVPLLATLSASSRHPYKTPLKSFPSTRIILFFTDVIEKPSLPVFLIVFFTETADWLNSGSPFFPINITGPPAALPLYPELF